MDGSDAGVGEGFEWNGGMGGVPLGRDGFLGGGSDECAAAVAASTRRSVRRVGVVWRRIAALHPCSMARIRSRSAGKGSRDARSQGGWVDAKKGWSWMDGFGSSHNLHGRTGRAVRDEGGGAVFEGLVEAGYGGDDEGGEGGEEGR